jgi:Cu(I)/Ag(I) efflux system membrane fusion protein
MKRFLGNRVWIIANEQQAKNSRLFALLTVSCALLIGITGCNEQKKEDHSQHQADMKELYTCPMLQDSVFSDKPGKCPKCGMDLIKAERQNHQHETEQYTCPMHTEVIKDKPGTCPVCGMDLVKKEKQAKVMENISLDALLKPTNEFVIASLPLAAVKQSEEPVEMDVLGYTAYNTSSVGYIAARISGRIERLYVKYRYQKISKGQKIMDIYSPELMTAQQNLLFLLKNDINNSSMIEAAKQKLLLLGFAKQQLQQVIESGNPSMTVAVYSNYSGHIHEAGNRDAMPGAAEAVDERMNNSTQNTQELNLKEGMYVQKGQVVFSVYDPSRLWILLNIYPQDQFYVKAGDKVRIVPETKPGQDFRATITYMEPFFRKGSKTIAARVNYDNSELQLPIGGQVKATIFSGVHRGMWLPKEAVLSLGLDKVVFLKTPEGFKVHKIKTGHVHEQLLQITAGLNEKDSVAANAQYLVDSESFVKAPS